MVLSDQPVGTVHVTGAERKQKGGQKEKCIFILKSEGKSKTNLFCVSVFLYHSKFGGCES